MSIRAIRSRAGPRRETKLLSEPPPVLLADGVFEGYASLFGTPDLGRDVVEPGAFADSLARRGAAGVRMLWQHDPAEPVGRWLSLREDASGLRVRGRLSLAVGRARELAALMREGAVDGLSIGFRTVEATRDRRMGLRRLLKVDLWEVSIVTFPMQPGARVGTAKHLAPPAGVDPLGPPAGVDSLGLHPGLVRSIGRARARLLSSPTLRRP